MKQQVLSPRMQNAEEANLGAKMFRIGGDFEESVGHGAEQQVVQFDFVLADEGVQVMRQAEHDMEVRGLKKFPLSGRDPTLPCLGLTLGAMPIVTRNGDLSITCRNRHCPKCQAQSRQRWIEARENELLATSLCAVSVMWSSTLSAAT